jgi:uncharacterized metal-binding protein YceD (DUF177 family)
MPALTDIVDLGKLGLAPGGAKHLDLRVAVGKFVFGDQDYLLGEDPAPVGVDITRTISGNVIRVRLETTINGPCMRCFGDLSLPIEVDHSEVHEPRIEPELASEYVDGLELDLAGLVRDATALALPATIASPVDESGVCTQCERSAERLAKLVEDGPGDGGESAQPDPRWAKLRELEL